MLLRSGLLAAGLSLIAGFALGIEPELIYHWRFAPGNAEGKHFVPLTGDLPAQLSAAPTFDEAKPQALLLSRETRVSLSSDPTKVAWPTEAISLAAWVMIDQPQQWGGIVSAIQDNGSYERGWLLGYRDSNFCFGLTSEKTNRLTYLTADQPFVPGNWYHVAATYDGTTMRLYVDGGLAGTSTDQQGKIAYPPKIFFDLAAYHDDNEHYPAIGQLAEVRIHRGALSAETLKADFDREKRRFPGAEPRVASSSVQGWPTFMHDNGRSGITAEDLKLPLDEAWIYAADYPPQPAWPPPARQDFWHNKHGLQPRVTYDRAAQVVSDGKHVWLGSSADDQVRCLGLQSGAELWNFFTEGPVRLAPTFHAGRLYFGSDDGCAYCLKATTGELIWRRRAVKTDRRIPGNGRMISSWPIRTGILIENGHCRFAAGLFPTQGVHQFVLDAETGSELAQGPLSFSAQGYMELQGNRLIASQGRAPKAFVDRLKRTGKAISPKLEALPEEYPLAMIGTPTLRFAGGSGKVAAFTVDEGREVWTAEVEGDAYGLAIAGESLLVSTSTGKTYCFRHAATSDLGGYPRKSDDVVALEDWQKAAADEVRQRADGDQGWCLILDSRWAALEVALGKTANWKTISVTRTPAATSECRARLTANELLDQYSVHEVERAELPYQSQLFNLIVADGGFQASPPIYDAKEILRLLRPGGVAIVDLDGQRLSAEVDRIEPAKKEALTAWVKDLPSRAWHWDETDRLIIRKPAVAGSGQWSHMYADPANTSCSNDKLVGNKLGLQWFGQPGPREMLDRHHRTVPPLVVGGRMFIPADNRVIAVDTYNGTILWDVETPYSRRVAAMRDAGSMAAATDRVYVATAGECLALDALTGEQQLRASPPPLTDGQPRHWGYVAVVDNGLFGSATKPGASRAGHSRRQIDETYWDNVPIVTSDSLFRLDRHSGEKVWQYEPTGGALLNPTFTIGGGRVYFIESGNPETLRTESGRSKLSDFLGQGSYLVALDRESGKEIWRRKVPLEKIEQHLYLSFAREKLIVVGSRNERSGLRVTVRYDTHAFSATDGKHLWQVTQDQGQGANGDHGEQDHHPTIVGDTVIVEPKAYDLNTGKSIDFQFARGGHGCGSLSASANTLFFRAGNPTMFDLTTQARQKVTAVSRPGCWINIIPADGLLLIPEASSGCTCNFSIQASMAFAPEE